MIQVVDVKTTILKMIINANQIVKEKLKIPGIMTINVYVLLMLNCLMTLTLFKTIIASVSLDTITMKVNVNNVIL